MFLGISILPVLVAVVADMIIGSAWYSPFLFGNYWMAELGFKKEDMKGAMKAMGFMIGSSLVTAIVLGILLKKLNVSTIDGAIETAFLVWLGFVATTNALKVIFEKGKMSVYFIQVAYQLISMIVMAMILVSWK